MTNREWNALQRMHGVEITIGYTSEFCGRYKFEVNEDTATVRWYMEPWRTELSDIYVILTKDRELGNYDKRFLREAYDIVHDSNFKP